MDFKLSFYGFFFVLLVAILPTGNALKCYWCNSVSDRHCDTIKNGTHLVDCETQRDKLNPPEGGYTLCRKTTMVLPNSEARTVRTCGWVEHQKYDCYYTTTQEVKSTVCQCMTDACNSANSIQSFTCISLISIAFWYLMR